MFDLIVMTLILLVIAIAEAFVIWSYARDNRDLTRQLSDAQANDARDPKTGRYVGRI